jgi:hypothetical protein
MEDETSVSFVLGGALVILLTIPAGRELVGPVLVAGSPRLRDHAGRVVLPCDCVIIGVRGGHSRVGAL